MAQLYSIAYASVAVLRDMAVARQMRLSKVFPSLSCGVPVIYAGQGEAAELLAAHHCGVVVEPENPERLADAVLRLAADRSSREDMGRAGRQLVQAEYSWAAIVTRWLAEIGYAGGRVDDDPGPARRTPTHGTSGRPDVAPTPVTPYQE